VPQYMTMYLDNFAINTNRTSIYNSYLYGRPKPYVYGVYIILSTGKSQLYSHIRHIYTVLANDSYTYIHTLATPILALCILLCAYKHHIYMCDSDHSYTCSS
jgi:hypothetical protein